MPSFGVLTIREVAGSSLNCPLRRAESFGLTQGVGKNISGDLGLGNQGVSRVSPG